jgi:hypothetical protein
MKKIIKQIKDLTKGYTSLNIGEDTFLEPIIFETINKDEEILIEQINELTVTCTRYIHGKDINEFQLPFEALSVEVLGEVLENLKQAHSFLEVH